MNKENKGIWIPNEILKLKGTDKEKLGLFDKVLLSVYKYYTIEGDSHCCLLTNDKIADMLGVSLVTVKRAKTKLKQLGFIRTNGGIKVWYQGEQNSQENDKSNNIQSDIEWMLTDEAKADKLLNPIDLNMLAILQFIKDGKSPNSDEFSILIKHPKGKWDNDNYTSIEKYFSEFGVKCDSITLYRSINKLQRLGYIQYKTGISNQTPKIRILKGIKLSCNSSDYNDSTNNSIKLISDEEIRKENTNFFITHYLNPNCSWSNDCTLYEKMENLYKYSTEEALDYASKMKYSDFLKTPYWKTISDKVKYNRNYTCQLCGATDKVLNVHHPSTYTFRGRELYHIDELTCLCKDCHGKFHNK